MSDLIFKTAQELAISIREHMASSVEVLEAHLAYIAKHNPPLNAIITLDEDGALKRAREADAALARGEIWGPLHGVPFTVKDSLETAGIRTTSGFPPLADYVPTADASAVAKLKAAGAILMGKTNLPPLAGDYQTANPIFGRTNNPWNLDYTPGGSTGGGAAAIASGMTPLEIGSDVGGSVRVPAHYCGVYTIKPTDRLVSTAGHIPELPGSPKGLRHMAVLGPLARSVADLELALRVIAGPDGRRWETAPVPLEPASARPIETLRLAWTDDFGGVPVSAGSRAALSGLVDQLVKKGWQVARHTPEGVDFMTAWETHGELFQAEVVSTMPPEMAAAQAEQYVQMGATLDSDDPTMRGMARAFQITIQRYTELLMQRDGLISALESFFGQWDALICPVAAVPAIRHSPPNAPVMVDDKPVPYWLAQSGFTGPFNLTGNPVVVLPVTRSRDGLPIGVQVVGKRWSDMSLLALAKQLAQVIGPFRRPPGY